MKGMNTTPVISDELGLAAMWTDGTLEFYRPWRNAWLFIDRWSAKVL